ncbi:FHA domain-containing protein [Microbacterium sp. TWP3-1-2b2]|uniref:FHA domain-containing protein n=1 Tax=Microbacterium sp. TWP3-1-2b2 TaxID=2804651 RepID=UPI003CEABF22
MQTTYRPGKWYVLVAPGALVALSPDTPEELIASLWDRQREGSDLAAVIDALTEHASGSFAAMLPFAAVFLEGPDARIAVRGDVTVQLTGPEGSESFTGTNVTTWSERFAQSTSRIVVSAGDAEDVAPLPITGGVVRASNVSAEVEPSDVTAPAAADASPIEDLTDGSVDEPAASPVAIPVVTPTVDSDDESGDESVRESPDAEAISAESPPAEIPDAGVAVADVPAEDSIAQESTAQDSSETATEQIAEIPHPVDDAVEGATLVPSDITDATDADEFEQLFGATVASPNAIVQPSPAPPAPTSPFGAVPSPGAADGDHDGATISAAEARALRQKVPTAEPDAPTAVLPVVAGTAGRVRVSTGQVITLDRTVIIGRRPRSTRASGADLPHLVAVESPQQDISRSHLEIRPEGDTVVVVDLHTTNGSTLLRPGADPMRLHPGEQTLVLSADVVDLGDGVTVTFEDLP